MIYVLHSVLAPGAERDYENTHRRVPDELVDAIARSGITDWSIHRVGRHLIHLIESEDLTTAFERLAHETANDAWQTVIGSFVERFDPASDAGTPLAVPALWSLATQLSADGEETPS